MAINFINGDPYKRFNYKEYEYNIQGWNSSDPAFEELITEVKPELIIEVGTWLGASAIHMATLLKQHQLNCKIICVDTWLGSPEMWTFNNLVDAKKELHPLHGYPQIYYRFLANICYAGMTDIIIPFPQTSFNASVILKDTEADLIYLDGGHDYDTVLLDLQQWTSKLSEKGVIFGDDYEWSSVKDAVTDFAYRFKNVGKLTEQGINKWVIRKSA